MPKFFTDEQIVGSFQNFYKEHGRYPNVSDTKLFKNLPSFRTLDRRYGGVVNFRKMFNLEYTDGRSSSGKALKTKNTNEIVRQGAGKLERLLKSKFEANNVIGRSGGYKFKIITETGPLYCDYFYTTNFSSKLSKYRNKKENILLVTFNDIIPEHKPLPQNIKLITIQDETLTTTNRSI